MNITLVYISYILILSKHLTALIGSRKQKQ
jgi:hypothetical protein